ncbi:NAD(P)H-hydrate dehydratase [Ideonella sp. DXS29W]|uniref:Bifunctional NAD(P)H-hydrate repair enzyme n=1 Tax=Ideonella lacteola TaxID=2984193 RepID=A0ABU9C0E5_9BURK
MNGPRRVIPGDGCDALHDTGSSRAIERAALAAAAPHELMERAGLAVARLALSIAPHAQRFWVAAGPGNNGGDGLVAARWLLAAGKAVLVSCTGDPDRLPPDARQARHRALLAGVPIESMASSAATEQDARDDRRFDVVIDALLGLGQTRPAEGAIAELIHVVNRHRRQGALVLAIDLPTGLCADTGRLLGSAVVQADVTLSLLTLKPGLFTGAGRDLAGDIWCDDLAVPPAAQAAAYRLTGSADARAALAPRRLADHASHKGRFGDLWVVGGDQGMQGAAQLAAQAGLRAGAGRVYLSCLADASPTAPPSGAPELMVRSLESGLAAGLADSATVVCGCGGGMAVQGALPLLIDRAPRLVLDADALNRTAEDPSLAAQLEARGKRGLPTILTPHPLEAARLLGTDTATLQADRPQAARRLAQRFGAVVVLKGSGSMVAAPVQAMAINASGNARLATAGTGDVLAGLIGGCWSSHPTSDGSSGLEQAFQVACGATWLHGRAAESSNEQLPLIAHRLVEAIADAADALG